MTLLQSIAQLARQEGLGRALAFRESFIKQFKERDTHVVKTNFGRKMVLIVDELKAMERDGEMIVGRWLMEQDPDYLAASGTLSLVRLFLLQQG